jgi:hypothetical protein
VAHTGALGDDTGPQRQQRRTAEARDVDRHADRDTLPPPRFGRRTETPPAKETSRSPARRVAPDTYRNHLITVSAATLWLLRWAGGSPDPEGGVLFSQIARLEDRWQYGLMDSSAHPVSRGCMIGSFEAQPEYLEAESDESE